MINFDMDGVIADFESALQEVFGDEAQHALDSDSWRERCIEAEVFRKMQPIPEGIKLLHELIDRGFPICFMTSTSGAPHHAEIARQKLDWLERQGFGDLPVSFCMGTAGVYGKGSFAAPGRILIDDREKVCAAWRRRGGIAIRFERDNVDEVLMLVDLFYLGAMTGLLADSGGSR